MRYVKRKRPALLLGAPADDLGLPLPDRDGVADLWRRARIELDP